MIITPNPAPTIGTYNDVSVAINGGTVVATPSAGPADANNNLTASPVSVLPTTLPGGGTISVNAGTAGVVTITTTSGSTLGATPGARDGLLDTCGASVVRVFNVTVVPANPIFTDGPPPSPVTIGTPYSFGFTATGNPAPAYAVSAGTLPSGLALSSSGVLSGTPDAIESIASCSDIAVTASEWRRAQRHDAAFQCSNVVYEEPRTISRDFGLHQVEREPDRGSRRGWHF